MRRLALFGPPDEDVLRHSLLLGRSKREKVRRLARCPRAILEKKRQNEDKKRRCSALMRR